MKTLSERQKEYGGKWSPNGWPCGKYPHRLGSIHSTYENSLRNALASHIGCPIEFLPMPESDYKYVVVDAILRIGKYSELYAFIQGFKAGCGCAF